MRHLYVHVPFCARRCVYCDFSIAVRRKVPARDFVGAVLAERDLRRSSGDWDERPMRTLYLGGGTPSLLDSDALANLIEELLRGEPTADSSIEITIEVNPDDVTQSSARRWAQAGVNRVSVGIQSFSDSILNWMHRTHNSNQGREAISILRGEGIENVSIDLLSGMPPVLDQNFSCDLDKAIALDPNHISVYGLTAEAKTAYGRWISRNILEPIPDTSYAAEFLLAHDLLEQAGYEHYEISNYAKPGKKSVHNSAYWDGSHYGGLGPSAHAYDGRSRRWNIKAWEKYYQTVTLAGDPTEGRETLGSTESRLERMYLALRTSNGLRYDEMADLDGLVIAKAENNGWASREEERWRLTPSGWLRIDELVGSLTTLAGGG